ncbi:AP-3 complex subunit mu-1 [Copidosoma floridanum]|uniref:AP-3 complex subunit mu-1 n=1 Tax=Copidosoma floridanum TaxID=29053 RepID=UPI000C6FAF67|nr:AP-3 complex subunit mu-1 [Copidosoma floridanum]
MIHSIYVINSSGDVFLEKHWKSAVARSLCDYFFDQQHKVLFSEDTPPVIATPHHYLISIYRCNMFFVAVCSTEVIKDNYVVIYELLDEMLDNGFPFATESNILQELIKPPNILRTIANTVTGKSNVSSILPIGQLSNVPWRRMGVKYTNNEAYFDIIEEVDAIIDKTGAVVFAEIQGCIDCCIKLSGMPDLTLTFVNPRLFDDVSFHPCVRFKRWESEKILSFIPPDGNFRLISYHIASQSVVTIPLYVRHNISLKEQSGGKFDISVGPKQTSGKTVKNLTIELEAEIWFKDVNSRAHPVTTKSLRFLYVRNAFNLARWSDIRKALCEQEVPKYLRRVVDNNLKNRVLRYNTTKEPRDVKLTSGKAQGSALGPDV